MLTLLTSIYILNKQLVPFVSYSSVFKTPEFCKIPERLLGLHELQLRSSSPNLRLRSRPNKLSLFLNLLEPKLFTRLTTPPPLPPHTPGKCQALPQKIAAGWSTMCVLTLPLRNDCQITQDKDWISKSQSLYCGVWLSSYPSRVSMSQDWSFAMVAHRFHLEK